MKKGLMILIVLFLSACSTVKPTVTRYKLLSNDNKKVLNHASKSCSDKTLSIPDSFSLASLKSSEMSYIESDDKIYSYLQARWQESPNSFITLEILKNIRESKLFKTVQSSKSRGKSDFILENGIEDFMQYYDKEKNRLYVKVVITSTLVDTHSKNVVASRTFSSRVEANEISANGGVEALSSALYKVLDKKIEWLEGVCR